MFNANGNGRLLSKKTLVQLMVAFAIFAWATRTLRPLGIQVGRGAQISETRLDFTQGRPDQTNRDLDVAIQGTGFFRVKVPSTLGDGRAYTRHGNFFANNRGELVVGSSDGYRLDPSITLPKSSTDIQITMDGLIVATVAGKPEPVKVGELKLTRFAHPQGLTALGGGLYQETGSSGPAATGTPGQNGTGQILQAYLEERQVELNSQRMPTVDQALQTIANLMRS